MNNASKNLRSDEISVIQKTALYIYTNPDKEEELINKSVDNSLLSFLYCHKIKDGYLFF